jgi:hypothetical protein
VKLNFKSKNPAFVGFFVIIEMFLKHLATK